jgi:hypothetical protein
LIRFIGHREFLIFWGYRISGGPWAPDPFVSDKRRGFHQTSGRAASWVSAKFNWMLERELTGLIISYEEAGPIIEDLDPFGWTCRPLPVSVQPIQPRRKWKSLRGEKPS